MADIIGLWSPVPRCGKSTVANLLCAGAKNGKVMSFATPLKDMMSVLLLQAGLLPSDIAHYSRGAKEERLPILGVSYRHLCQTLGTDWGRRYIRDSIWTDLAIVKAQQALADGCDLVVFDDVRFPDEGHVVQTTLGGQVWAVRRVDAEASCSDTVRAHRSEAGLGADFRFDHIIENHGVLQDLVLAVQKQAVAGAKK